MLSNIVRISIGTLLLSSAAGAVDHTVRVTPSNRFEPADLTIQVGDTVTWVNDGGLHNVAANDGSFRCAQGCDGAGGSGSPSSASWSFTLTFDTPGVVDYLCEVHAGLGMVGRLRVEQEQEPPPPPPDPEPGALRFGSAAVAVGEEAASAIVSVRRVGGSDGEVSVEIRTEDGSARAGLDYEPLNATLMWADGNADEQSVPVQLLPDSTVEGDESFDVVLSSPGGGAGLGSVRRAVVTIADDDQEPTTCVVDEATHCLQGGRFQVRVRWRDSRDREGEGRRIDLTEDSGLFWFFGPNNVELLIKVLDACNLPGFENYWVFLAAVTDVEYQVEVLDTETGRERTYSNALGERPVTVNDTAAFDTCP